MANERSGVSAALDERRQPYSETIPMSHLCSFTYAAFALAFVYFVLFILVLRYLLNLMRSNSTKKRAQKIFLAILIAQTLRQSNARPCRCPPPVRPQIGQGPEATIGRVAHASCAMLSLSSFVSSTRSLFSPLPVQLDCVFSVDERQ